MEHRSAYQPITARNFTQFGFPDGLKCELIDGIIRRRETCTPAHSRVSSNILAFLHTKLRRTGRRPYNSDMGVQVTDTDVRYPDVSIYCGNPATPEREQQRVFTDRVVIFEVLSASTARTDEGEKRAQYRPCRRSTRSSSSIPTPRHAGSSSGSAPPHGATTCSPSRTTCRCPR